jgi:hypothetical protein
MKTILFILALSFPLMFSCGISRDTAQPAKSIAENSELDSTEYELIIFDIHFDSWLMMNSKPVEAYEQEYLARWNANLVNQWNHFSPGRQGHDCRPMSYIDYDSSIDYGKEFNHKLYYYFWYMHKQCRIFFNRPGEW